MKRTPHLPEDGFTLVELLVAAAGLALVVGFLYAVFLRGNVTSLVESDLVQQQQAARAALYIMGDDIRMAGYSVRFENEADKTANNCTFIEANATHVGFGWDEPQVGGGAAVEVIRYRFNNATNRLDQAVGGGGFQVLVEDVVNAEFLYFYRDDGNPATPDQSLDPDADGRVDDIREVAVTLLVRTEAKDPEALTVHQFEPVSAEYWEAWGWTAAQNATERARWVVDGGRRGMLLTTRAYARNAGL